MRIGLLTLPVGLGYGGIMQAFALKTALTRCGHDVVLIRRLRKKHKLKRIIRRIIKKYVLGKKDTIVFIDRKDEKEYPIVTQYIQPFIDRNLQPFSPKYWTSSDFKGIESLGIDAVVVGSDQVWRPGCMDNIEDFFLQGIDCKIKRYAYAASLGVSDWVYTERQTSHCREAVKMFSEVSVREKSGISLCQKHFGITPELVLDPTLLFDGDFYLSYVSGHDESKEHKICAYILDRSPEKMDLLSMFSNNINKDFFFSANENENREAPLERRIAPSIESWIDSFYSADCVFTDSFHGCAFSIIFRKPFYAYINKGRGADRFYSLVEMLGLEQCIITEGQQLSKIPEINWTEVERRLVEMRKKSNDFLSRIK